MPDINLERRFERISVSPDKDTYLTQEEIISLISNAQTFLRERAVLTGGYIKSANYQEGVQGFLLDETGANFIVSTDDIDLALQGWGNTMTFSAVDADTVEWNSGQITLTDGTIYNITAGNTGNMSALTYIYFDANVSTTVLQTSTTQADAVGTGKIAVAVAKNNTDTASDASFQVFGGSGGVLFTADNIATNTITGNEVAANTITAVETNISELSAITANVGTLTAGTIRGVLIQSTNGANRIQMTTGDRLQFYRSNALRGQMFSEANGDITIVGVDDVKFNAGGVDRCQVGSSSFRPFTDSSYDLGTSSIRFDNTYTDRIRTDEVDFGDWEIFQSGTELHFDYQGGTRMILRSNGDLLIDGDLTEDN